MTTPPPTGLDAAEFLAPLVDYEKPIDQPYGKLHISDELKEHIAKGWPDWSQQITDADLAGLDFGWMKQLQQFDRWTLLTAGRLKDYPMKDFFATRKDALLTEIRTKAALDKDLEAKLQTATDEWKSTFTA